MDILFNIADFFNLPVSMTNALITSIILGIMSGILGSFIVLRQLSLMGDALSHAVLPGVAISYLLGINVLFGATVFGILASILIEYITKKSKIKADTAIGIILSTFFALGIILISQVRSGVDLNHVLFGNILAVTPEEIFQSFILMIVVIVVVVALYKELMITSFDPVFSQAAGLNNSFFHYLLMLLLTIFTVSSLSQVGIVLVVAMLVIPAATSYLWNKHLSSMIVTSSILGVVFGLLGVVVSFKYNLPTSATIVLIGAAFFIVSFIFSPKNGIIDYSKFKSGNKSKYFAIALISILFVLGFFLSSRLMSDKNHGKLQVLASYSIIADMASEVGGDKVEVHSIVPIGVDPHSYEPTPEDSKYAEKADLVFYNGLNLETGKGWFEKLLSNGRKTEHAYVVSTGVTPFYLTENNSEKTEDPHAWLNIQNGIIYVENIKEKLIKYDPDNKDYYESNAKDYIAKLTALDEEGYDKLQTIPKENRVLVTSEGAFKYFAKRYDMDAEYIWEINTDNQGTPEQMVCIDNIIKERNVKALFVESSVAPKTMEAVARNTGKKIAANLFTDSLAKEGQEGDNYLSMMKWNIDKIHDGLK